LAKAHAAASSRPESMRQTARGQGLADIALDDEGALDVAERFEPFVHGQYLGEMARDSPATPKLPGDGAASRVLVARAGNSVNVSKPTILRSG
jgi:hypothetical protein